MSAARFTRLPFLRSFAARIPVLPLTSRQLTKPTPAHLTPPYSRPTRPVIRLTRRSFSSTSSRHNSPDSPDSRSQTFSARLKHLIKTYGWHALGVYLIIGVVDFTFAFGLINFIGAAHVARFTASTKAYVADYIPDFHISMPWAPVESPEDVDRDRPGGGDGSLYAMIVLAYTVHKTLFLPVRVGLTAGLTPKLVGWLRQRGWAGAGGARRAADHYKQRVKDYKDRERGD
jgi:N-terminal acetyltransferase 2